MISGLKRTHLFIFLPLRLKVHLKLDGNSQMQSRLLYPRKRLLRVWNLNSENSRESHIFSKGKIHPVLVIIKCNSFSHIYGHGTLILSALSHSFCWNDKHVQICDKLVLNKLD